MYIYTIREDTDKADVPSAVVLQLLSWKFVDHGVESPEINEGGMNATILLQNNMGSAVADVHKRSVRCTGMGKGV